jgi:chemotaxis protein MotB
VISTQLDHNSAMGFESDAAASAHAPARAAGHADHDEDHGGHPHEEGEPWLMSFADLILNLLLFFIVLYSISTVDEKKLQQVAEAINGEEVPQTIVEKAKDADENGEILQEIQTLMQKLNQGAATDEQKEKSAKIQSQLGEMFRMAPGKDKENDLFEVILAGEKYFARGSPLLTTSAKEAIFAFAQKLKPLDGQIGLYIEGHAAPAELDPKAPLGREWQLASERAAQVLLALKQAGLRVKNVSTAGFGAQVDLAPSAEKTRRESPSANQMSPLESKVGVLARARVHLRVVREVKSP